MNEIQVCCDSFALKRTLPKHLPELLPIMKTDLLLTTCLGEPKLRVILVELMSGCFPQRSILILPIMSSWKFNELAALKIIELCSLAIWDKESTSKKFKIHF